MTRYSLTSLFIGFLLVAGCGGPELYPVSGRVTWEGQPATMGQITFYPIGGGRPSLADIQEDGSYVMSTYEPDDGAPPGAYEVAIECVELPTSANEPKTFAEEVAMEGVRQEVPQGPNWIVPEQYASPRTSKLQATVEKEENLLNFDLP